MLSFSDMLPTGWGGGGDDDVSPPDCSQLQTCAWEYACHTCPNGSPDPKFYPFLDWAEPSPRKLRKDMVKPSWYHRWAILISLPYMVVFIIANFGLSYLQIQGNYIPDPLDSIAFNLFVIAMVGFYLLSRLMFVAAKSEGGAKGYKDLTNSLGSLTTQIVSGLDPREYVRAFTVGTIQIARYSWNRTECRCEVIWEAVSPMQVLCEVCEIIIAYGYVTVFSYRKGGVDPCKLPMSPKLIQELIMRRDNIDPSYNGAMHVMIELRMLHLEIDGIYLLKNKPIIGQINNLDGALGQIDKTGINAFGLVNNFLLFWVFVYGLLIVWILSTYGQVAAIIIATMIQFAFTGTLLLIEKQANPFNNIATNPYSTIPIQDWKHEIAYSVTVMFLNLFRDIHSKSSGEIQTTKTVPLIRSGGPSEASLKKLRTSAPDVKRSARLGITRSQRGGLI